MHPLSAPWMPPLHNNKEAELGDNIKNGGQENVSLKTIEKLADDVGGEIEDFGALPDGSGFVVMSMPLPKDHWLYREPEFNVPPMPLRMGTDVKEIGVVLSREWLTQALRDAGRYAVRCATMNGSEPDFDPDALIQNLLVGFVGYHTPDGLSEDGWANPSQIQQPKPLVLLSDRQKQLFAGAVMGLFNVDVMSYETDKKINKLLILVESFCAEVARIADPTPERAGQPPSTDSANE